MKLTGNESLHFLFLKSLSCRVHLCGYLFKISDQFIENCPRFVQFYKEVYVIDHTEHKYFGNEGGQQAGQDPISVLWDKTHTTTTLLIPSNKDN